MGPSRSAASPYRPAPKRHQLLTNTSSTDELLGGAQLHCGDKWNGLVFYAARGVISLDRRLFNLDPQWSPIESAARLAMTMAEEFGHATTQARLIALGTPTTLARLG